MEAYARPIRELAERLRAFVWTRTQRLFHITTDEALWGATLELVMGFEHHADNVSPFVLLDHAHEKDGHGWDACARKVREDHAARRLAMAEHGYALGALGAQSQAGHPLARFGAAASDVIAKGCAPLDGLLLVVAPAMVDDGAALDRDLRELVRALPRARWIVIERGACSVSAELARATSAGHGRATVDEDEAVRELEATLDASAAASADAPAAAQTGAAWPKGALPPGAGGSAARRAGAVAAAAAALGMPAAMFTGALRDLRQHVLRGAVALRRGDPIAAAQHQGRAARSASAAGMDREALLMEMIGANHLVAAEQRDLARERYQSCADRAKTHGWADLAAQSLMAIGALHLVDRDRSAASIAYGWAGRAARDGGESALAIEGFRMAGQCAAEDGNHEVARKLFSEALSVASPLDDAAAGRTSAPVAARQLAERFDSMGGTAQAQSLRAQAQRMEAAANASAGVGGAA
ncbi:MAG: hypothetical protein AB7S26_32820 [Sandaracinaceae bacterium]